jgi:two-component system NtrC family sensor kinase
MDEPTLKAARILIIDDESANVRLLERLLQREGYTHLRSTTDARQALPLYTEVHPDLVLLDLAMPYLDGFQVLAQLTPLVEPQAYLPILVLTADVTLEAKRRMLESGAKDFLTKPFDHIEVLLRIRNLLETRFLHLALAHHNERLEQTVRERTQQLLQAEKLATMGELLAGVAHELNNPLTVVIGQTHLLREGGMGTSPAQRAQKIEAAADRCVRIVRNFLALARQHTPERSEVTLNEVVGQALELLAYELRTGNVEVVGNLAEDLPTLWADAHRLHQVLVNLIVNAEHAMRAMPSARRITVATRFDRERSRVRLEVGDTGPGIPPEIRARIFEAFFTTKPSGQGTGLGLSLCQGIIEEHGGTITVESEPGRGATFLIELPVVAPPAAARELTPAESLPAVTPKAILVVDDEPEIAAMLAELLERAGHRVDVAANGAVALDMLERKGYDLILTDTKMPMLDGVEFYRTLERRFPQLCRRLMFVTGDVLDQEKRQFLAATGAPCLAKPFDLDEVRRVVHRMLASAANSTRPPGSSS